MRVYLSSKKEEKTSKRVGYYREIAVGKKKVGVKIK